MGHVIAHALIFWSAMMRLFSPLRSVFATRMMCLNSAIVDFAPEPELGTAEKPRSPTESVAALCALHSGNTVDERGGVYKSNCSDEKPLHNYMCSSSSQYYAEPSA